MPSINVSEADFNALACAAADAMRDGDMDQANALDKLARKTNAALTSESACKIMRVAGMATQAVRWQDMPSTLDPMSTFGHRTS